MLSLFSCSGQSDSGDSVESRYAELRQQMVEQQISRRDVTDEAVLTAMRRVPRHVFVPEKYRREAYRDGPLPIGHDQTISQPYIVAVMTELLRLDSSSKVLEIGTGSGYQAAILAEISDSVYTIEIIEALAVGADSLLDSLGYTAVQVRAGDGYRGWPEKAPFDAIIVTAAPPRIPEPLVDQLKIGGRMVVPVGDFSQDLILITKKEEGVIKQSIFPVRFVPMTGEVQEKR
ncbi:MAG: protein-L-isoaspartate(D-aspartate) O-methyltransferase [Candidatus Zixiibacteriota bacterium]|nr:MAG: protein-L-isoaspartate(D-aspartate) O-methyltransferase [candidate division Zixibacteria bacterium]